MDDERIGVLYYRYQVAWCVANGMAISDAAGMVLDVFSLLPPPPVDFASWCRAIGEIEVAEKFTDALVIAHNTRVMTHG